MDISFATDSNLFSKVVEELRKEKVPLLDVNIRERYMQHLEKKDEVVAEAVADAVVEEEAVVAPKKAKKK